MNFDDKGIFGFDVSFYQAVYNRETRTWTYIDFQKMKDYGASFVVIKCGQFNYLDPTFVYNWQEAKRAGIPRSSYWFLSEHDSSRRQAQKYWDAIKDDPGEGPLVVDYEYGSGGKWEVLYDFLYEIKILSGYPDDRIWIYTGYYYWIEHRPQTLAQRAFFSRFPLWLAYYTDSPERAQCPSDWEEPILWQEGTPAIGLAAGAQSREIDYNILNGNDLAKHFSGAMPIPPTPLPTGTTMPNYTGTAKSTATPNVRIRASYPDGATIGAINPLQSFKGDILENGWMHIIEVGGAAISGWSSSQFLDYDVVNPPTPPSPTITLKHTFETYSDGSVRLDGTFIP